MNILEMNKSLVFAATLIVAGVIGLVDSASANNGYNHNQRHNYKYDSYNSGNHGGSRNGYSNRGYKYNGQTYKKQYKNRYKRHYSPSHRSYSKGYVRNYPYSYSRGNSHRYIEKRDERRYRKNYSDNNNQYGSKSSSHCYSYKVITQGGKGGFRFQHDKSDFKRVGHGGYASQICGRDSVEFELSKVDPAVSISIEINGRYFHYAGHSGHDRYVNNWHRKYFSLNLKHY